MKYKDKVNVLGTEYNISFKSKEEDSELNECDGYCATLTKQIVISTLTEWDKEPREVVWNKNLRHEIIHAFLFESGLAYNSDSASCWAVNEEMVDWIAIQFPKMQKAFEEVGCNE